LIGFAMTAAYVALLASHGDKQWTKFTVFVIVMAVASSTALAASFVSKEQIGRRLLVISAVLFAVIGTLGILTIGLPFLVSACLAGVGATRVGGGEPALSDALVDTEA
jgi:hypothetical protein